MRSSEFFAEAARMTVDAVKALAECFARAFRQAAKAIRKCGREGCKRFVFVPIPRPYGVLSKIKAKIGGLK